MIECECQLKLFRTSVSQFKLSLLSLFTVLNSISIPLVSEDCMIAASNNSGMHVHVVHIFVIERVFLITAFYRIVRLFWFGLWAARVLLVECCWLFVVCDLLVSNPSGVLLVKYNDSPLNYHYLGTGIQTVCRIEKFNSMMDGPAIANYNAKIQEIYSYIALVLTAFD